MNMGHHHKNIIERKLEQLPAVDTDLLWKEMHLILDKKMPQRKERRRFIVWWLLSGKGLLLLTIGVLIITGSSLFFLSTKETSPDTVKKLPDSPLSGKIIEDDAAKIAPERAEKVTTASAAGQITNVNSSTTITDDYISATTASRSTGENVINNISIADQAIKQAKKYMAKDQFNQPIHDNSKATANFDSAPVYSKSIYQDFLIATNDSVAKDSLNQQPELVVNKMKTNSSNNN
ncbi:MAG TPA: hypothetical protein VFT15_15835, partial [Chitinophagaceae bacterium]|nr:hypothetical protein [Chitinophagaceae bacterium]